MSDWTRYDVTPVPKPRQTRADVWKRRPAVLRYRAFADELRAKVRRTPLPSGVCFHVVFVMPLPKRFGARGIGLPHTIRPDFDNLAKSFADALFPDSDAHLWDMRITKVWGEKGEIWVRSMGDWR
jgi:Holliday junction resolvase RusA-like endonuclease